MEFFIQYPFNPITLFLYAVIIVFALTAWYIKFGKKRSLEKFVLSPQFLIPIMIFSCMAAGFDAFMSFIDGKPERALFGVLITIALVLYNYNLLKNNSTKK